MQAELRLTLDTGGVGHETFTIAIGLHPGVVSDLMAPKPSPRPIAFGGGVPMKMKAAIEVLRQKKYRKDLLIAECKRLGTLLAERMEDAEGWHDESRVEPAKSQLKGNQSPARPCSRTKLVAASGASVANEVAAMEVPAIHQGSDRPDRKKSPTDRPARREKYIPTARANTR